MKGILDRFEGEKAVILIEETKEEYIVNRSALPEGSKIDTVFALEKNRTTYKIKCIDVSNTKVASQQSSDLMAKLRAKSRGSKFKK
ncbi:DUF3006 domain-containing protein [Oceanobacillus polygoni]|uniref:DUF3006 family protein n=1 Tax=Oceanobacillus polygoni TaxID=1235259 RepID=A0A9X1CGB4_9BACI|nr:DUF3006 domain-containing protein [Oceanobacillus polygoni]MBP2077142.1 hypothetical protein [Oceanobacillus polygoni]